MTLKFVIILQNLIKTYHRKSGKSKCDRKVTELNVEITRIRSRVNGVLFYKSTQTTCSNIAWSYCLKFFGGCIVYPCLSKISRLWTLRLSRNAYLFIKLEKTLLSSGGVDVFHGYTARMPVE